jgi:PE-PPE domain
MRHHGYRRAASCLVAAAGTSLLGLASITQCGFAFGDDTALVMGPDGVPIPPQSYVNAADLYIQQADPGAIPQALDAPVLGYPASGANSPTAEESIPQGVAVLNSAIEQQLADHNHADVFTYSLSTTMASMEMEQLQAEGVPSSDVSFVMIGDLSNPDGGFLERFDIPYPLGGEPSYPSFGFAFSGATPSDLYPTDIYTAEYDGYADFPTYPANILSDLNALLGLFYEHETYLSLTSQQIQDAIELPTVGDTMTNYYMIPTDSLPLLEPLQLIPVIGQPLYDLLAPDMTVLVNLGYGNIGGISDGVITGGWDPGPANEPTTFELFPTNLDWSDVLSALENGAQQGITTALSDLENPANYQITPLEDSPSLSGLLDLGQILGYYPTDQPTLLQLIGEFSTEGNGGTPIEATNLIDAFTGALSADIGALKPVVDTALTLAITIPEYDANDFIDGLESGNLLNAIGDPIAADIGQIPFIIGFDALLPLLEAGAIDISEFTSL